VIASAAGGGLAIRVRPDELERAMEIVGGLGMGEVDLRDGEIVTTMLAEDPATVTRALAEQGIYLGELAVRRATREQAFLQLTGSGEVEEHEG
jgi:hypothetical protein